GDLRLVGGVGRVPTGVFQEVALNYRGRDAVVITQAEVGAEDLVLRGQFLQGRQRLKFAAAGGELQRASEPNPGRYSLVNERVQAGVTEQPEHLRGFLSTRPDVAAGKVVGMRK